MQQRELYVLEPNYFLYNKNWKKCTTYRLYLAACERQHAISSCLFVCFNSDPSLCGTKVDKDGRKIDMMMVPLTCTIFWPSLSIGQRGRGLNSNHTPHNAKRESKLKEISLQLQFSALRFWELNWDPPLKNWPSRSAALFLTQSSCSHDQISVKVCACTLAFFFCTMWVFSHFIDSARTAQWISRTSSEQYHALSILALHTAYFSFSHVSPCSPQVHVAQNFHFATGGFTSYQCSLTL